MDLGLGLEGSLVIVTGAAGQIGSSIVEAFLAAGCYVGALDINIAKPKQEHARLHRVQVDTTHEESLTRAWEDVSRRFDNAIPTICVAAAALDLSFIKHHRSIIDMSPDQFRKTLDVNTTGTFITAKIWLKCIANAHNKDLLRNVSFIIIGSEAGALGVPGNPDYAASKSAVQYGLMLSLAPDATRILAQARVNAIAPGAVDTPQFRRECSDDKTGQGKWLDSEATVISKRPVEMTHVARMCLMLASDRWSGSTTGQVLRVDGGKSGRLFWTLGGEATW